jgi:uncharacterized protein YndB with AHSA1/START domain
MTADQTTPLVVHVERVLPAPRARIFELHSEADQLAKWWGPKGFTVPNLVVDLRVGGRYRIAMQPPDGDPFFLTGEFRRVEPPAHLSYSFRYEEPDVDDQETVVDFSLRELGGSTTTASIDQGPFLTEARRALHLQGWTETLDRLYELVVNEAREGPKASR